MTDIALTFTDFGGGDLVLLGQDLGRDDGLESAVLVSLFTDRRVSTDQLRAGDDRTDLRGWWGDYNPSVPGDRTGSLLWTLSREKQTQETLARARQFTEEALEWMVDDKVSSRVDVATEYIGTGVIRIAIEIYRPGGSKQFYRYDYEWSSQSAKRAT